MKILQNITDYKNLENSQKKVYERVYFSKIASLPGTECNSTSNRLQHMEYVSNSTAEDFLHVFYKIALFEISEKFLRDIFAMPFLTKLQTSNLRVVTLPKIKCLTKIFRKLAFNTRGH